MSSRLQCSAALAGLTSLMAACFPSTPVAPLAVREPTPGSVEILYRPCDPVRVKSLEIVAPRKNVYDESDPRTWKVSFEPPTPMRDFIVGQVPPGARVDVPIQELQGNGPFIALVRTEDGGRASEGFRLSDLDGGRVRFGGRTVTMKEFESNISC